MSSGAPGDVERMVVEAAGAGLRLASGAIGLATSLALLPLRLALKAVLPAPEPLPDLVPAPPPSRAARPEPEAEPEAPAPGPEIHVSEPWEGYDRMTAPQVIDRLRDADTTLVSMVRLYEERHKARKAVLHRTAKP